MRVPQDDTKFGSKSKRSRRKSSGKFLSGAPKDFDDDVDQFRGQNGRFKKGTSYGADNVRDDDPDFEFVGGRSASLPSKNSMSAMNSGPALERTPMRFDLADFEPDTSVDDDLEMRFSGL